MSENTTPTYIIGHKNPDADAICSAIAYAALKQLQGESNVIAARCGNSNARIDAILKQFDVPLPPFIGDLSPRLRDIMVQGDRLLSVNTDSTTAEALELIDKHDIRALPVTTANGHIAGLVSIFSLGEFFIPQPRDPKRMRHVHTNIDSIIKCLKADVINLIEPGQIEDFFVRVGAMDIGSFGKFSKEEGIPESKSIIVVGDRYDIQQKSIELGVRLLVITGGLQVDENIIQMARKHRVSLITSRFDSAATSWIIRTATKIAPMLDREVITFRADEKVAQVKRKIANTYAPVYCVVNEINQLIGVFSKSDILRPVPTRLILVDHNEISQAVNGASDVNIVEIIDHHRLGNPPTAQPILFVNEPVGSTCTIIAEMFRKAGFTPEPGIAGILMSGMISDTLNLQSPTSTERERQLLPWLEGIAGISGDDLAQIIFSSGSVILNATPEAVIHSDLKLYDEGKIRFSVSQVEELGFTNFWAHSNAILDALEAVRAESGLVFSCLLVTDINTQNSLLLVQGEQTLIDEIAYPALEKHRIFEMPGIVSRKKQLIPYLTTLLQSSGLEM